MKGRTRLIVAIYEEEINSFNSDNEFEFRIYKTLYTLNLQMKINNKGFRNTSPDFTISLPLSLSLYWPVPVGRLNFLGR